MFIFSVLILVHSVVTYIGVHIFSTLCEHGIYLHFTSLELIINVAQPKRVFNTFITRFARTFRNKIKNLCRCFLETLIQRFYCLETRDVSLDQFVLCQSNIRLNMLNECDISCGLLNVLCFDTFLLILM